MPGMTQELRITLSATGEPDEYVGIAEELVGDVTLPVPGPPLRLIARPLLEKFRTGKNIDPQMDPVKEFGKSLFDCLIREDVANRYRALLAGDNDLRLRLVLPGTLEELPWELMFDGKAYVCLSPRIALVRAELGPPVPPLPVTFPLRILVVVSTPRGKTPLSYRREIDQLLASLKDPIKGGRVVVDFIHGPDTAGRMQSALRRTSYCSVHFIAHGEEEEGGRIRMALEDDSRQSHPYEAGQLWSLAKATAVPPRLVFLNICLGAAVQAGPGFTSLAHAFLAAGCPVTIGHRVEVLDVEVLRFAAICYEEIAKGEPIDAAVACARRRLAPDHAWHAPVLHMRTPTGQIFQVNPLLPAPQPALQVIQACAESAATAGRWAEAASYEQELALLVPGRTQLETVLKQEALEGFLGEAEYAEENRRAALAVQWYSKYLKEGVGLRPQGEYTCMEQRRLLAEAWEGITDPWLEWRE